MKRRQRNIDIKTYDPSEWQAIYYDHLYKFARYKLEDKNLIEDLIQDAFVIGLESLGRFQGRCTEKTWLTAILKNLIYACYRQQKAKALVFSENDNCCNNPSPCCLSHTNDKFTTDTAPDFFDLAANVIQEALNTLPELWRKILIRKYQNNEPVNLICEDLNISPSNCWIICHRAKVKMKSSIAALLEQ